MISSLLSSTTDPHHAWTRGLANDALARARERNASTGCLAIELDERAVLVRQFGPSWVEEMERKVGALVERIVGAVPAVAYAHAGVMFVWLADRDQAAVDALSERVLRSARFGGDGDEELVTVSVGRTVVAAPQGSAAAGERLERLEEVAIEGLRLAREGRGAGAPQMRPVRRRRRREDE